MKKCICIIITLSLVISSISAVYAVDISTSSAIKYDRSNISLMAVGSTAGTLANGDTVAPVSSTYTSNYWTGSTMSGISGTLSTWGQIITNLTDSFSRNIQSLYLKIYPYIDNVEQKLDTLATKSDNLYNTFHFQGVSAGQDIYSIKYYAEQLYNLINAGVGYDTVKIDNNTSNGFSRDYLWKKYLTTNAGILKTISPGGILRDVNIDFSSLSVLGAIESMMYYNGQGQTNALGLMVSGVRDQDTALNDYLYDKDLNTTMLPRTTVWANQRDAWSNFSYHLARLAYVLASDEEIEARQAASDNQTAAVDNFVKPSGSGSASSSDLSDMAGISSGVQDTLATGVNPLAAFSSVSSDSSAWEWFTDATKNALDTTNSNNRLLKSNYSNTPYLDDYYSDLQEKLGGYRK